MRSAPAVVEPRLALDAWLYPCGEHVGWAALQAAEGESNLLLVFDPGFFSSPRNLLLERQGGG